MSKESEKDKMREEYDISKLKGGVGGKYYPKAKAGTNLVLIDPDLQKFFPNDESVNRALRLLLETASDATQTTHSSRKKVKKKLTPDLRGLHAFPQAPKTVTRAFSINLREM